VLFGADNCHNVDRIMRLPGSINLPDAKKAKKGRTPTVAELIEFDEERVYDLGQFTPAAVPASTAPPGQATVDIAEVQRLASAAELDRWNVPDRVKVIIVQGRHPDEGAKPGDDSRSAWLFDVVCNLVRAGVPNDVIFSVITDPDFAISESVLEHKTPAKYARRQIEEAKKRSAPHPEVAKLDERHAIVENIGGKCLVIEEVPNEELKVRELTFISFATFKQRYNHRRIVVGTNDDGEPIRKELGSLWLNETRHRFHTLRFAPRDLGPSVYNTWEGFAVEPREGDCSLYLDHLRTVVCGGIDEHYQFLLGCMAHAVQRPWEPLEVAVVVRGGQGVGKGVAFREFGGLFGRHFMQVVNPDHVFGKFNRHLMDKVVLFADEAFYAGDRRHESILKALITEPTITIEPKGVDSFVAKRYFRLFMASNKGWVVPADADDRRFFVLSIDSDKKRPKSYFRALFDQLDNGGREALLYALLHHDLSQFDPHHRPETDALTTQKIHSLRLAPEAVRNMLATGNLPIDLLLVDHQQGRVFVPTLALAEKLGLQETALGLELARASEPNKSVRATIDGKQYRGFWLARLDRARHFWAESHGLKGARWDAHVDHWTPVDPEKVTGTEDNEVPF